MLQLEKYLILEYEYCIIYLQSNSQSSIDIYQIHCVKTTTPQKV
jgi:hypothetical protein